METENIIDELNALKDEAFRMAVEHGFHDQAYTDEHWMMLIICEVAEAVEADRKGRRADLGCFEEQRYYCGPREAFERNVKDTVEDELADVCIRILDFMGKEGFSVREDGFPSGVQAGMTLSRMTVQHHGDFCHIAYRLAEGPMGYADEELDLYDEASMNHSLGKICGYCEDEGIDILKHIRLKMEYNRTRERLHGKRY